MFNIGLKVFALVSAISACTVSAQKTVTIPL